MRDLIDLIEMTLRENGAPAVLYHYTTYDQRESILEKGLICAADLYGKGSSGIYFTTKNSPQPRNDCWQVDLRGIPVEPDTTIDLADNDDGVDERWFVTYVGRIAPSRLKLMGENLRENALVEIFDSQTEWVWLDRDSAFDDAAAAFEIDSVEYVAHFNQIGVRNNYSVDFTAKLPGEARDTINITGSGKPSGLRSDIAPRPSFGAREAERFVMSISGVSSSWAGLRDHGRDHPRLSV